MHRWQARLEPSLTIYTYGTALCRTTLGADDRTVTKDVDPPMVRRRRCRRARRRDRCRRAATAPCEMPPRTHCLRGQRAEGGAALRPNGLVRMHPPRHACEVDILRVQSMASARHAPRTLSLRPAATVRPRFTWRDDVERFGPSPSNRTCVVDVCQTALSQHGDHRPRDPSSRTR
jgi:hypothetical protein